MQPNYLRSITIKREVKPKNHEYEFVKSALITMSGLTFHQCIVCDGARYHQDDAIALPPLNNIQQYAQIVYCLKKLDEIYFLCNQIKTIGFIDHLCSYELSLTRQLKLVHIEELYHFYAHDIYLINGKHLLPLKHDK
jgi:hypothetical protein